MTGLTPGMYATRSGKYEVDREGRVWLIGGEDLPEGSPKREVGDLPGDAVMTSAALGGPMSSGATPPGKAGSGA